MPRTNGDDWWQRFVATRRQNTGVAWRGLGEALQAAGRREAAILAYWRAMARDPVELPARHGAGQLLRHAGRLQRAAAVYRELLAINPHDAVAAGHLGHILVDQGATRGYHEAEGLLRRALDLGADRQAVLVPLCRLFSAQEREREILALTAEDTAPMLLNQRAQAQAALGDFDGAQASLNASVTAEPDNARAWYHLAGFKLLDGAPNVIGGDTPSHKAQALAAKAAASDGQNREFWGFAAAHALEGVGAYDDAWGWYLDANARIHARVPSNIAAVEDHERRLIETYTPPVLNRLARAQLTTPGPAPVFVVGMPRSGTTLMERIIGAHADAAPLGERADLQEIMTTATPRDPSGELPWPERAAQLPPVAAGTIAGAYLARVNSLARGEARVAVDKMPEQFRQIGLIAATMPQARIVHMTRDPRDTGLSCFTGRFHDGLAWAFDLSDIARRQASYQRLMAHWRSVLPRERLLEVPYEELVRAPEDWTARVLDFLGLAWDPACVHGHAETREPVRTSSVAQVRRGISASSVGRWRRFGADRLGPVAARAAETAHASTSHPAQG
jgi:tetratricopeptide (TPR) repeat protein